MDIVALALCLALSDCYPQPCIGDVATFPSSCQTDRALARLDRLRAHLLIEKERDNTDPQFWDEWLKVVAENLETWQQLSGAQEEGDVQAWLVTLRGRIGREAYRLRRMPSTNPVAPRLWAPWLR